MIKLKLAEDKDLEFITSIRTEEEVQNNLGTFLITTPEKQIEWFECVKKDSSQMYLIIYKNEIQIGYVRLSQIDYKNRSICVGADIREEDRGKGYGYETYEKILDLCFNKMNMNRAWLFVLRKNERAIHIYKKIGFIEEGCQRQAIYSNGQYIDYIMMSILKEEFNA